MRKFIFAAATMFWCCGADAIYVNLTASCSSGMASCIIDKDVCYWCGTGKPPGNCTKGYAGCGTASYIIAPGAYDVLYTADGFYGYTCSAAGWLKSRQDGSCRETEYFHHGASTCMKCPTTGFVGSHPEIGINQEIVAKVGLNRHSLGVEYCCISYMQGAIYTDDTGEYNLDDKCCYSGDEPSGGQPDDNIAWCH